MPHHTPFSAFLSKNFGEHGSPFFSEFPESPSEKNKKDHGFFKSKRTALSSRRRFVPIFSVLFQRQQNKLYKTRAFDQTRQEVTL